jgi:serine phosphatase RsbU (regulator of sigma subunit)/anti-sigma regulatory factor (Ser/Thr protein kinase)
MNGREEASPRVTTALDADRLRHALVLTLVGVLYYLGARLGLSLSLVEKNVTPMWPPTGIAVAAFLLLGRSMWPAVGVSAFLVNLPISSGPVPAAITAAGNTVAPLLAATLLLRFGVRRELDRRRDALSVVFLAALVSMVVSATVGTATLAASGVVDADRVVSTWVVWWTGDAMGVLVFAPFLLSLLVFWERRDWSWLTWGEAAVVLALVAAATAYASLSDTPLLFLALPLVGWAAWRFQLRGAAPAALIASLIATWAAVNEAGPFEQGSLFERMLTLQGFNACVALASFFLAALVSERQRIADELAAAAAELDMRVQRRTAELSEANARVVEESQQRSQAQLQLLREELRAEREHEIAATLQRSLLPDRLPEIVGVDLAARYVAAAGDVQVGGDWYDVVHLPDGMIGLAIGDVAGHGLQAAVTMGQLRMALRAYALQDPSPAAVMRGLHRVVSQLPAPQMATLIYLVFDPDGRELTFANAGHPPALVIHREGSAYLADALAPPLGATADSSFPESTVRLFEGSTLLLYTDGLVERRGESLQAGLDELRAQAGAHATPDLDELCEHLLSTLVRPGANDDDIALLALRPVSALEGPLRLTIPAEPQMLAVIRRNLSWWLRQVGVDQSDANEILVACGEACANVVQHAYGLASGTIELDVGMVDGTVDLTVADRGSWRRPADRGGGWGVSLMESLMDTVELSQGPLGTEARMRKRVRVNGVS